MHCPVRSIVRLTVLVSAWLWLATASSAAPAAALRRCLAFILGFPIDVRARLATALPRSVADQIDRAVRIHWGLCDENARQRPAEDRLKAGQGLRGAGPGGVRLRRG